MNHPLQSWNFRLLIFGQASSLFGSAILRLALSMYVLEITGSATVFAGMLAAAGIPTILLSPFGGAVADRVDKGRMMVVLDLLNGLFVAMAVLLLPHGDGLVVIGGLLVLLSVAGAFETPVVQACLPAILTGDDLVRGNAVVNQVSALAGLVAPALGGIFYAAAGLGPVLWASVGCFLLTAASECFLHLGGGQRQRTEGLLRTLWQDSVEGVRYLCGEGADLLRMLLLAAVGNFLITGTEAVGLPYLIREVLGLGSGWYGGAESAIVAAAIGGSVWAGAMAGRLRTGQLAWLFAGIGGALLPAGVVFLLPLGTGMRYFGLVVAFCGVQWAVTAFSVFAVSLIQGRTPMALMGKVMACTAAVSLCAQPLGQMLYGVLFDRFRETAALVLIPTALVTWAIGMASQNLFRRLEKEPVGNQPTH